ncbi:MAG: hypothetical protein ACREMA_20545 [Longimicrobiales bacterium]
MTEFDGLQVQPDRITAGKYGGRVPATAQDEGEGEGEGEDEGEDEDGVRMRVS